MTERTRESGKNQKREAWLATPERGSAILLRAMTILSLRLGRRASRVVLYLIVAYFYLAAPAAARESRRYLRRALKRSPTVGDRFAHLLSFATVIHDRVYLLNDRFDLFNIDVRGEELLQRALRSGTGCFLMGAHFGSFELTRAYGQKHPGVTVAMAMYAENAQKIGAALAAINPQAALHVIRLGSIDAMLQIQARLNEGAFVGVLGDRALGDEATLQTNFLETPAPFPIGPWRAAALLRRPVLFMAGIYCGANRYRIVVDEVADFTGVTRQDRELAIRAAITRYAALLEERCCEYPYNWFNFFNFWHEAA